MADVSRLDHAASSSANQRGHLTHTRRLKDKRGSRPLRRKGQPPPDKRTSSRIECGIDPMQDRECVFTETHSRTLDGSDDATDRASGPVFASFRLRAVDQRAHSSDNEPDEMQVSDDISPTLERRPKSSGRHQQALGSESTPPSTTNLPMTSSESPDVVLNGIALLSLPSPLNENHFLPIPPQHPSNALESGPAENDLFYSTPSQLAVDSSVPEVAWPVNDRRHTYDYADFLHGCQEGARIAGNALASDIWSQEQPLRQRQVSDTVVLRSCVDEGFDLQGLYWNESGLSRETTLGARKLFRPLKRRPLRYQDIPRADLGSPYVFRNFVPKHRAAFSHYQLRNQLAASGRHSVFYAANGRVRQTSLPCPTLDNTILDSTKWSNRTEDLQISCISASSPNSLSGYPADEMLLVGGLNGEYLVLDMSDSLGHVSASGSVTNARYGLVTHIHQFPDRLSGLPQAAFCTNEGKMRLMDVRTLHFTSTFSYDHPINCSATSADGRLRALVGDMRDVFITDSKGGEVLATLRQHVDHGFACAWSHDGRYVATAAEDETVAVWDARNWSRPMTVWPTVMSCARSLHFTHRGALVVAENEDLVSIYTGNTFREAQHLQFFGSIAGVALINGGEEIAIANCDRTVGGLLTFELRSHRSVADDTL